MLCTLDGKSEGSEIGPNYFASGFAFTVPPIRREGGGGVGGRVD